MVPITYSQIKLFIGKRVNIKLKDDSVIVNVKIDSFIRNIKTAKIIIKYDQKQEEIPIEKIKEIVKI